MITAQAVSQIDWTAIGIILTVVGAWSALLLGVIAWFIKRSFNGIDARFDSLGETMGKQASEISRIDRDLRDLRTEMHAEFVRRDDSIRQEVVINAKLDALGSKIENLQLRTARHG